jgi:anti-sigma factor (TIGR02949 family)
LLSCKDFLRELSDFLDDAVDPKLKEDLKVHLKNCPNCWVVADTTRKTVEIFQGACAEPKPVPEGIRSRVLAALQRKMTQRKGCS